MLKRLKFHLTIHSPFRPLEGFLIDMKVLKILFRNSLYFSFLLHCSTYLFSKTRSSIPNVERLRKEADSFLISSLYSDVLFLYPPSQVNTNLIIISLSLSLFHLMVQCNHVISTLATDSSCCFILCFYCH